MIQMDLTVNRNRAPSHGYHCNRIRKFCKVQTAFHTKYFNTFARQSSGTNSLYSSYIYYSDMKPG